MNCEWDHLFCPPFFDSSKAPFDKLSSCWALKDTHRKKAPSNKTLALSKSMNMDI